jgi:hypothetical protein
MVIDLADVHVFAAGAPGEETARLGGAAPATTDTAEAAGRAR